MIWIVTLYSYSTNSLLKYMVINSYLLALWIYC